MKYVIDQLILLHPALAARYWHCIMLERSRPCSPNTPGEWSSDQTAAPQSEASELFASEGEY
jgi:hypothetical protein